MLTRALLKKTGQSLLDFFYPPHCINCRAIGSWLCQNCIQEIPFIIEPVCQRCGEPNRLSLCQHCINRGQQDIQGLRIASHFDDNPIRTAIHHLKYRNHKAVVSILGEILADAYQRFELKADVIIPVPLHATRLNERGYNQSELLAEKISTLLDIPMNNSSLNRIHYTKPQVGLTITQRQQNVKGCFSCQDESLHRQKVLLIDDVCTTGSTLNACAIALKESFVKSVWGLTLAKSKID